MDLREWSEAEPDDLLVIEESDALFLISPPDLPISLSCLSPMVWPKSTDVPGVLDTLTVEPNEANAPEPRPKAAVGEETLVAVGVEMALNGLLLPWDELSPPNRFVEE